MLEFYCDFLDRYFDRKDFSTKRVSKQENEITWQRFKTALEGSKDIVTSRRFRILDGRMVTYPGGGTPIWTGMLVGDFEFNP